ncbi:unnamed protein product [Calicophoron daubneyi]|uniref:exodeoxyribonuclease III n=1 Tax=Calicophoron daubneyi TaxID=300641 RepID=A0AAV2T2J7_CALDB
MRRRAVSLQDKGHNSKKTHQGPRPKSSVKGIRKSLLNNVDSNTLTAEHVKMTTDKKQNDKAPETAHGATNLFPWCLAYPGSMVSLNSPQIKEWTLKLASWNVNGLRAWIKANGKMYADEECPDVLAVQEIKCSSSKIPPESKIPGYYSHWYSAVREGYSGTGLYTRKKPINITYGIKNPKHDSEGRVITAEYENFYLIAAYVPNSGDGLVRLPYRQNEWDPAFASYLKDLDKKKPIIVCGDLNVAHNEIGVWIIS